MLFGEDRSYVLCVVCLIALHRAPPFALNTRHLPQLNLSLSTQIPVPGKRSHPKPERLLSLLNSYGPSLSLIAFFTPFIVLWIISHSLYHFYQVEHLPCGCLGCWGYNGEEMMDLSLFPTLNFMPMNQIFFPSIQRILHSDSYIEHVQPVFGE